MKRLLAMLLCLCLTVLLLASCSSDFTLEDYADLFKKTAKKAPVLGEMNEITQLSGKIFVGGDGDLLYFTATDNGYVRHTIFNVADNDVVLERANSDTTTYQVSFRNIYGNTFFTVKETMTPAVGDTTYKTTVYDSLGEVVAAADKIADITYSFDLFELDDTIYRVSLSGAVTVLKEKSAFNQPLIQFTDASEDYYYYIDTYSSKSISVYDKSLEFVSYWSLPFEAPGYYMNVLSNGDVLVQAQRELPADADEYDYYESGSKYALYSWLVDPASGEADELDINYLAAQVITGGLMSSEGSKAINIVPDGIDNLASIAYIENKTLDTGNMKMAVLGNDAKIKGDFLPELKNMDGSELERIGDNLYSYTAKDGETVLCNAKGETLGYGSVGSNYNECYLMVDDKIYTHSLELALDYKAEKLNGVCAFNHTAMFKDENGVYKLLADGELKTVSSPEGIFNLVSYDKSYYVVSDGTALTVYNEYGDKIDTLSGLSTISISTASRFDNGSVLLMGADAATGLPVYYLLEGLSEPVGE